MPDLTPHQTFLVELQHLVGNERNAAAKHDQKAREYKGFAAISRDAADAATARADQWQKLLDFAVLADRDTELAHAFANAVLDRGSVDPFASVTTYYAEWADRATEAFGAAADAERHAQRDEYVNDGVPSAAEQNTREVEHVDYAEVEAVREIEREMAIEAGDDSELDRQVAEDDARNEREYEAHEANEAWLDAHPDEFVDEDAETENGYTGEQLNGNACSVCGGGFKAGEASQPSGYVLDHGQLFAHTACLDEDGGL